MAAIGMVMLTAPEVEALVAKALSGGPSAAAKVPAVASCARTGLRLNAKHGQVASRLVHDSRQP